MASTRLQRNPSTQGTTETGTLSVWVKRSSLNTNQNILTFVQGGSYLEIYFRENADTIRIYGTSFVTTELYTNRKFRDTNAWYHIVVAIDSTQATASNRVKLYINGVQETSFSTANYPGQGNNMYINGGSGSINIGSLNPSGSQYFDGSMSHFHWIDGTAYDASAFGEYDANGVWKIKTEPSVTYGNNGFWWLKDTNSATDSSPNSNTPTIGGTLTKTEDNPSNVFATLNPLKSWNDSGTLRQPSYSYGNTRAIFDDAGQNEQAFSTLASSTGKFYCEVKATNVTATENTRIGIGDIDYTGTANPNNQSTTIYYAGSGNKRIGSSSSSYGSSYTNGDIIGVAMDLDNNKLYFSKNGTWQNSGIPTSGSTGTGAIDISDGYNYCFITEDYASSGNRYMDTNFGNGYFGSTQISSAGTNASGNGIFEYDVPTGYTALSTKGLNL